jgi:DNA-binding IclR family transcriptional regulator
MPDDGADPTMRVYKFAIHGDLPTEVVEELRRAHVLQNQLVEVFQDHSERVAQVWGRNPELVVANERWAVLVDLQRGRPAPRVGGQAGPGPAQGGSVG